MCTNRQLQSEPLQMLIYFCSWADMLDGLVEQLKNNPDLNSIGKVIQQMWNSIAVSLQQNLYSSQIILQQFRSLTSKSSRWLSYRQ